MEDIIYRYRFLIGGILILIILIGVGVIWWDKNHRKKLTNENQTITELQKQNDLLRQELSRQISPAVAGESSDDQTDKININTADAAELDKLPNIGPARAADIIAYREENNGFRSIEELKNISGIGDKTFEEMKDLVTIGNTE